MDVFIMLINATDFKTVNTRSRDKLAHIANHVYSSHTAIKHFLKTDLRDDWTRNAYCNSPTDLEQAVLNVLKWIKFDSTDLSKAVLDAMVKQKYWLSETESKLLKSYLIDSNFCENHANDLVKTAIISELKMLINDRIYDFSTPDFVYVNDSLYREIDKIIAEDQISEKPILTSFAQLQQSPVTVVTNSGVTLTETTDLNDSLPLVRESSDYRDESCCGCLRSLLNC